MNDEKKESIFETSKNPMMPSFAELENTNPDYAGAIKESMEKTNLQTMSSESTKKEALEKAKEKDEEIESEEEVDDEENEEDSEEEEDKEEDKSEEEDESEEENSKKKVKVEEEEIEEDAKVEEDKKIEENKALEVKRIFNEEADKSRRSAVEDYEELGELQKELIELVEPAKLGEDASELEQMNYANKKERYEDNKKSIKNKLLKRQTRLSTNLNQRWSAYKKVNSLDGDLLTEFESYLTNSPAGKHDGMALYSGVKPIDQVYTEWKRVNNKVQKEKVEKKDSKIKEKKKVVYKTVESKGKKKIKQNSSKYPSKYVYSNKPEYRDRVEEMKQMVSFETGEQFTMDQIEETLKYEDKMNKGY